MLYIKENKQKNRYEVYGDEYGKKEKVLKYIADYLNERKVSFYGEIIINIFDKGYYWTISVNGKETMALSKTEPGVYSNNYYNYVVFKNGCQSKKEFVETLFEAVKSASNNIKEIPLKDTFIELEKLGFAIGLKAKNQDNTYYIFYEGYKVGTYNIESEFITCFGFTGKDSYKLLRAKEELLNFVLCKKETPDNINF